MAVTPRKTKKGVVFWVVTRGHAERIGFDRREADRVDARRKKELKAGTFQPVVTGAVTVRAYLTQWGRERTNRSAHVERTMLRIHVLEDPACDWFASMKMEDVRPFHARRLVTELKTKLSQKSGQTLKPKYVANVSNTLKAAFRAAVVDEVVMRDVWLLPPGLISKKSEPITPYSREEAASLLASAERGRLVWLMLALYTGMRCGEVCGRRWRDWDRTLTPLTCLDIATQYQDEPLKTDRPRKAPVHPELERVLDAWWSTGFAEVYLRSPRPDDFIVPNFFDITKAIIRSTAYKAVAKDCRLAKVTCRGMHATRHTFISAAQRDGAEEKVVEKITHNSAGNSSGKSMPRYTHREWDELCRAVQFLRPYGQNLVALLDWDFGSAENTQDRCSDSRTRTPDTAQHSGESAVSGALCGADEASNLPEIAEPAAELAAGEEFNPAAWALCVAAERVLFRETQRVSVVVRNGKRDVG